MKVNEVPQDDDNLFEGKTRDVAYALDENGRYTTVKSVGWDPKNAALIQAWEVEKEKIDHARELVRNGEKSPVFYHMVRCLMDLKIVAAYTGFSRFKVKRHFKPEIYNKLDTKSLDKYIYAFGLKTLDELNNIEEENEY